MSKLNGKFILIDEAYFFSVNELARVIFTFLVGGKLIYTIIKETFNIKTAESA